MKPTKIRRQPVPAPIKDTVAAMEKVLGDIDFRIIDTMLRWPEVEAAVMTWAQSCTGSNCGWAEYQVAQSIALKFTEAQRRQR